MDSLSVDVNVRLITGICRLSYWPRPASNGPVPLFFAWQNYGSIVFNFYHSQTNIVSCNDPYRHLSVNVNILSIYCGLTGLDKVAECGCAHSCVLYSSGEVPRQILNREILILGKRLWLVTHAKHIYINNTLTSTKAKLSS